MMNRNKSIKITKLGIVSLTLIIGLLTASAWIYFNADMTPRVESQTVENMTSYELADMEDFAMNDSSIELEMNVNDMEICDVQMVDTMSFEQIEDGQVPEPATLALLAVGGLGLLSRRRRRK